MLDEGTPLENCLSDGLGNEALRMEGLHKLLEPCWGYVLTIAEHMDHISD